MEAGTSVTAAAVFVLVLSLQFLVSSSYFPFASDGDVYQLRRKVQHTSTGLVICAGMELVKEPLYVQIALGAGCLFLLLGHFIRLTFPAFNRWFIRSMGSLMRPHEETQLPGAFYFLCGNFACSLLFHRALCILALLAASIVDPIAGLVGKMYGGGAHASSRLSNGKSLIGAVAGAATAVLSCALWHALWDENNENGMRAMDLWLLTGLSGALIEVLPWPRRFLLDDNFMIPVGTAAVLWLWTWGARLYVPH